MVIEIIVCFFALVAGYMAVSYLHRRSGAGFVAVGHQPLQRSATLPNVVHEDSIRLKKHVSSSNVESSGGEHGHLHQQPKKVELGADAEPTGFLKRGKTRDHVGHLNKLMAKKSVGESPRKAAEGEKQVVVPPPSHPVYCPAIVPLTAEQEGKMDELEKRVAGEMVPFYQGRHTLQRFLAARSWDLDRAETMLRDALTWRRSLDPIVPKYVDLVSLGLHNGLMQVMPDKDKFGRTICYICPRYHNSGVREVESGLRCMVWFMDLLWENTKNTHYKKFVVLFNMRGFSMKNNDLPILRAFLPVLQNYYPEVVGRIIVVEYPFIVWGIWKIIRPLLDVNTQNKVQFIGPDELADHFNPNTIPREIGGLWDQPEPDVDMWDSGFDPRNWHKKPNEDIQEDGKLQIL